MILSFQFRKKSNFCEGSEFLGELGQNATVALRFTFIRRVIGPRRRVLEQGLRLSLRLRLHLQNEQTQPQTQPQPHKAAATKRTALLHISGLKRKGETVTISKYPTHEFFFFLFSLFFLR